MKIKPLGFYVLVEMVKVEEVSDGGIIMPSDLINKEQEATNVGYVRAIGPTAYEGYPGCEPPEHSNRDAMGGGKVNVIPADMWGLQVGQKVEYRRFEGKESAISGYENYRYIPDSHIIGAIEE